MRVKDAFPSKYLCGEDLGGHAVTVTIEKVIKQRLPARASIPASDEWVMFFVGKKKGLIVRRKLARLIAKVLGADEMDHWPGKTITLYSETIRIAGEEMETVRARAATERKPATTSDQPSGADVGEVTEQEAKQ